MPGMNGELLSVLVLSNTGVIVNEAAPGISSGAAGASAPRSGALSFLSAVFTGLWHELRRRGGRNYVYDQRFSGEDGNTGNGMGMRHRGLSVDTPFRARRDSCASPAHAAHAVTSAHSRLVRTAFVPPATLREEPRKPSASGVKCEPLDAPLVILECSRTGTPTAYEGCMDIDEVHLLVIFQGIGH
ncbi:hypothetical protein C8R44DRAFT_985020 [Mycena epipterygia]|nr:hypothetical protein C8R44DRAFT_985020 [Mycena epipterygia]